MFFLHCPTRRSIRRWMVDSFFGVLVLALLGRPGVAQTLDDIRRDWEARQRSIRSFRFEWRESITSTKDSALIAMPRMKALIEGGDPGDVPGEPLSHEAKHLFAVDGERVRNDSQTLVWSRAEKDFVQQSAIEVFDGTTDTAFYPHSGLSYPTGFVRNRESHSETGNIALKAIVLWSRALSEPIASGEMRSHVTLSSGALVNGRASVLIRRRQPAPPATIECWVDPTRASVPVRWIKDSDSGSRIQLDISYAAHSDHAWVPTKWQLVILNPDGTLNESRTASVDSFAINDALPAEFFTITFPPGTWVTDRREGMHGQDFAQWIVRPDGTQRYILPGEVARVDGRYSDLVSTESGMAGLKRRGTPGLRIFTALAAGVVLVALAYWVYRRRATVAG